MSVRGSVLRAEADRTSRTICVSCGPSSTERGDPHVLGEKAGPGAPVYWPIWVTGWQAPYASSTEHGGRSGTPAAGGSVS